MTRDVKREWIDSLKIPTHQVIEPVVLDPVPPPPKLVRPPMSATIEWPYPLPGTPEFERRREAAQGKGS